jgi:hypothetical protein
LIWSRRNGTNGGGGGTSAGRDVVELTGGYYTSLEMATKAVAKIRSGKPILVSARLHAVQSNLDGNIATSRSRSAAPGVTVRYSHGYFAAAEPEPLVLKELIAKSRMELALSYDSQAKDIKLGLNATRCRGWAFRTKSERRSPST